MINWLVTFLKPRVLLIIVLLNFLLKLIFLTSNDIAHDEPFTLFYSQQSLAELLQIFKNENNPPLHFVITHFAIKIGGLNSFSVRLPSVIFSCLALLFLYKIALQYFSKRVAILSSVIFIFSTIQTELAHEARTYTLILFLTNASIYCQLKFLTLNKKKHLVISGIFSSLLIYSHYLGILILAYQVLIFALYEKRWLHKIKNVILWGVMIVTLYSPMISIFLHRFNNTTSQGTWLTSPSSPMEMYFNLWAFLNKPFPVILSIVVIGVYGIKQGLKTVKKKRLKIEVRTMLLLLFPVLYISMYVISLSHPMFISRYVFLYSSFLYLLLAVAYYSLIERLTKPNLRTVGVVLFISLFAFSYKINPNGKFNVRESISVINSLKTDSTLVILTPSFANHRIMYHLDKSVFQDYMNFTTRQHKLNIWAVNNAKELKSINPQYFNSVFYYDDWADLVDPNKTVQSWINSQFTNYSRTRINDKLSYYEGRCE